MGALREAQMYRYSPVPSLDKTHHLSSTRTVIFADAVDARPDDNQERWSGNKAEAPHCGPAVSRLLFQIRGDQGTDSLLFVSCLFVLHQADLKATRMKTLKNDTGFSTGRAGAIYAIKRPAEQEKQDD